MKRFVALGFLIAVGGCRCKPGPVDPVELGLRVTPTELDFGRVLEGDSRVLSVVLTATTRVPVSVEVSTLEPFSASPTTFDVPGAGDVTVVVAFKARNGAADGQLTLTVGDRSAVVPVRGLGVRPPVCVPSAPCIVSTYSLEEDRCIETQTPDDAACDPTSVCLEQGRCRAGQCLGVARRCDDNDPCTDDACAMDVGCLHTPHQCPAPTEACQVATCDSQTGCGFGPAPDLNPCGPVDCVEANFCFMGMCRRQATPEGFPCSPAIACLPEAQCHQQRCERVDTAEWTPDWSAPIRGEPHGGLVASGSTVFFTTCSPDEDGGVDGGAGDAGGGPFDAGVLDAGTLDAGDADAGDADAGDVDAGDPDAGTLDAGTALVCALTSYTGTGFWRYSRPYEDTLPRALVGTTPAGVVALRDGGVEVRAANSGALREQFAWDGRRDQLVLSGRRLFLLSQGQLLAVEDGGARALAGADSDAELASGDALFAWNADAGRLTRFELITDGGVEVGTWLVAGARSGLSVTGASVVLGADRRGFFELDGGVSWLAFSIDGGAGSGVRDDQHTLSSAFASDVFVSRCGDGGCTLEVDAFSAMTGERSWTSPMLRLDTGRLIHSTLVSGGSGDGVVTVVRYDDDGGTRAEVALYVQGARKALCLIPTQSAALEQALFTTSAMIVTTRRADGGVALESYPTGLLPVLRSDWPTVHGVGGTRADR